MKRISIYITIASVMTLLAGCTPKLTVDSPKLDGPAIQLDLSCVAADLLTKSKDAVDEDNENIIKSLDCFFYPKDATDANAALKQRVEVDARGNYTCYVNVNDTQINSLFPDTATECEVFVVANWDTDLTSATDTKLSTLKALAHTADFLGSDKGLSPQTKFVMVGEGKAVLVNKSSTICASGEISLERLAARVTLGVSVSNEYVETITDEEGNSVDITWTPVMNTLGVVFTNCAKMANLAGDPEPFEEVTGFHFNYGASAGSTFTSARSFYDTGGKDKKLSTTDAAKYTNRYECDRFYTYPAEWGKTSDDEPCFIIRLYWKYSDETGNHAVPLYYKVIIPLDDFDMNHWYDFNVRLSVLGSLSPQRPTVVGEALTYYVGDWEESVETGSGSGYDVDAEIRDARFIVVESNYYLMPNQNTISFPFESSHNCVLMGESINTTTGLGKNDWSKTTMPYAVREDFKNGGYQTFQSKTFETGGTNDFKIRIVNDAVNQIRKVEIEHVLNNDTSAPGYDYAEYTFKFRIAHDGAEGLFFEDITVVQRPALYIKAEKNPEGKPSSSTKATITFVNKGGSLNYSNGSSPAYGGTNLGFNPENGVNTGNTNPNMYVISTSVLSAGSSYIIADPRSKTVDNITSVFGTDASKSASAVPVNGGSARRLTNYYPIGTDSELNNMIAPKFRIASSWGATSNINYEYAKARCASYQENGYPAGRWRLPTAAEIAYMCQLTTDGVIPRLLGRDEKQSGSTANSYTDYWCGNGYVSVANGDYTGTETLPAFRNNTSSSLQMAVRCVYDEWYWENSAYPKASNAKVFTWGDLPR